MPRVSVAFHDAQGLVDGYQEDFDSSDLVSEIVTQKNDYFDPQDFMFEKNGNPVTSDTEIGDADCMVEVLRKPFARDPDYGEGEISDMRLTDPCSGQPEVDLRFLESWTVDKMLQMNQDVIGSRLNGDVWLTVVTEDGRVIRISDGNRNEINMEFVEEIRIDSPSTTQPANDAAHVQGSSTMSTPNGHINVYFISNDNGYSQPTPVAVGTTISSFLRSKGVDAASSIVRVNAQPVPADYQLNGGDRISVTPSKIKGA